MDFSNIHSVIYSLPPPSSSALTTLAHSQLKTLPWFSPFLPPCLLYPSIPSLVPLQRQPSMFLVSLVTSSCMLMSEDLELGIKNRENVHLSFWIWVISLSIVFSCSIHLLANFMVSLFIAEQYPIVHMYHAFIPLLIC